MNGRCTACRYLSGSLTITIRITEAAPVTVIVNTLSTNFDMRKQVVNLTGTLDVTDYTGRATREGFARMLVNASDYRENLPAVSVSVFADAPSTNLSAAYVGIAASQGWTSGFLGGLFEPDECITYKDAVKAFLAMLSYMDKGFTGDPTPSRISKFNYLKLSEEANRQGDEVPNQADCMNMLYNPLKTTPKDSSSVYGVVLDCESNNDGEISPISTLEDKRKGPILVRKGFNMAQPVPFDTKNANVSLNGVASILESVKLSQKDAGSVVVYYSVKSEAIWAYTASAQDQDDSSSDNSYVLLEDEIRNIYYRSTDVMTPIFVRIETDEDNSGDDFDADDSLDSDGYLTVELNSSEPQYLFSTYGQLEMDDEVVPVCDEGNDSYTAVDTIEY